MEKKVVFGLLILCGIFMEGIGTSFEKNEKLSDLQIRKKRVVGRTPNLHAVTSLVNLIKNGERHCPATLLTFNVALTSAECIHTLSRTRWQIQLDSNIAEVNAVIPYGTYNPAHPTVNNLGLVFFSPHPTMHLGRHKPINLYRGSMSPPPFNLGVYNWQHLPARHGMRNQSNSVVQKVNVEKISYAHCQNYYHGFRIEPFNFCTLPVNPYDYCEELDTGAPLFAGNELAGIFAYRGKNCQVAPDIFMDLQDHRIQQWIYTHVPSLRVV